MKTWLGRQSIWVVLACLVAVLAVLFGISAFDWWLAQIWPWWLFALSAVAVLTATSFIKAWWRWHRRG